MNDVYADLVKNAFKRTPFQVRATLDMRNVQSDHPMLMCPDEQLVATVGRHSIISNHKCYPVILFCTGKANFIGWILEWFLILDDAKFWEEQFMLGQYLFPKWAIPELKEEVTRWIMQYVPEVMHMPVPDWHYATSRFNTEKSMTALYVDHFVMLRQPPEMKSYPGEILLSRK
jgi:hypothetical protein